MFGGGSTDFIILRNVRAGIGSLLGSLIVVVLDSTTFRPVPGGFAGYAVAQRASNLSIVLHRKSNW